MPVLQETFTIRFPGTMGLGQTMQWPGERARMTVERT
jgi:hypothetical protein